MSLRHAITIAATVAVVGLALTGCSSHGGTTPTATETVTAKPTQSTPPSTSTPPASIPPSEGGTGAGGAAPNPNAAACTSANLTAAIARGSGGAAGSVYVELSLTNKGSSDCTLQGWPGVSLVGGGNGTQIGQAAKFDRSTPHSTVALKPGTAAVATLQYVQAGNYDASKCQPQKGDGFRVYPPGQKASVFASYPSVTGCKSTSVSLFTVGALHA